MSDIVINALVIIGTAVVITVIFVLVFLRNKKKEQVLVALAQQKGWRYEKVKERLTSGYRLYGPHWTLEGLRESSESGSDSNSSSVRDYTLLRTSEVSFSPGVLMIGPKQPEINLGGISEVLKHAMLKLMVGDEADGAEGIQESLIGRMALRERYMVWTNQEEKAREVLTPEVENALILYPGKVPPVVKINPKGLEVKLISLRLQTPAEINGLVAIGEAFLL